MTVYTYAHIRPDTGKIFYIGKGSLRRAQSKNNRNKYWKNIVNTCGGFNVEILADWEFDKEAFEHEKLLISCFKSMGYKLANFTDGGEGSSGYKWTKEQLKTLSEAHKGINKGLFAGEKCWFYGKIQHENVNYIGPILAINKKTNQQIILCGSKDMEANGFKRSIVYKCLSPNYPYNKSYKGFTFKRIENDEKVKNSNFGNIEK